MTSPITVRTVYTYEIVASQDVWWNLRTLLDLGVERETLHRLGLSALLSELGDKLKLRPEVVFDKQAAAHFEKSTPTGSKAP